MSNIRLEMPLVAAVVAINSCDYNVILRDEVVTELMSLCPSVSINGVVNERPGTNNHNVEIVSVGTVDEIQESDSVANADDCGNGGESTHECVIESNKLISNRKK